MNTTPSAKALIVYDVPMSVEKGNAPTDRVWAIYWLYSTQFPMTITLDQRDSLDADPYLVTVGEGSDPLCRLSDEETSWLIARKVGIR